MSTATAQTQAQAQARAQTQAQTPTVRAVARRSLSWIVVVLLALGVAAVGLITTGTGAGRGIPLSADNADPAGAKAVVEVLRQHGVEVTVVSRLTDAVDAARRGPSTVFVSDPDAILDAPRVNQLRAAATTLVVVDPDFTALSALDPSVHAAGSRGSTAPARATCADPVALRAATIAPGTASPVYRIAAGASASAGAVGCFPARDGTYSLVTTSVQDTRVRLLGPTGVLDNEHITARGNAALALGLLGEHPSLVWYLPTIADVAGGTRDLGALTPGWVTPLVALLAVVVLVAALWRGRRFGPLVVENLPVVVHSGETMEGRARLYQRSSARLRAADALRIGAISRLAGTAGLPSTSTVDEVVDAVAQLTGRARGEVRGILLDRIPASDREFMTLSDAIARLETDARTAAMPGEGPQNGRMDR